ncbi:hypothetical protein ACFQV2_12105 [Actinokineospora soli]|uniref:Prenyltransferase and squalene oxidase repeat-containing protein n=1 Tax=Actinokineospora soli TaxID=1048753 RepID=A0ABW2TK86_9PSEU
MTISAAQEFLYHHARVLDRHRFAYLFAGGDPDQVLRALDAYRNPDGGYGHALEPDGRGPDSQPLATLTALMVLTEVGALAEHAKPVADYLTSISDPSGAVPFAVPAGSTRTPRGGRSRPRAPCCRPPTWRAPWQASPTRGSRARRSSAGPASTR